MNAKILILLALLSLSRFISASGQPATDAHKTDSLKKVITVLPDQTEKVEALLSLIDHYMATAKYDEALTALKSAETLANDISFHEGLIRTILAKSKVLVAKKEYTLALQQAQTALTMYSKSENITGMSRALLQTGEVYAAQSLHNQAIVFYDSAYNMSLKHANNEIAADALLSLSKQYNYKGSSDTARQYAQKALTYYQEINNHQGISMVYNNIAEADRRQSRYTDALKNYHHALRISEEHNLNNASVILNNIGLIYIEQKAFKDAIEIYKDLITLNKEGHDRIGLALNYNNLGLSYAGIDQHEEAIKQYNLGLAVNTGNKRIDLVLYYNIGESYMIIKKNQLALKFYQIAFNLAKETDNAEAIAYCYNGMGQTYTQLMDYDKADRYLQKGRELALKKAFKELIMENYQKMLLLDSSRGQYRDAMEWQRKYYVVKDSLEDELNSEIIAEIQAQYETEKKDKEILKLTRSQELAAIHQANERRLFLITVIFLSVLAMVLIYTIYKRRKTNKLLVAQKQEIEEKNRKLENINEEINQVLNTVESQNNMLQAKNIKLEELHEEKDGLIGIVAHDLRSPIAKAAGLAELIKKAGPVTEEQTRFLELQRMVCKEGMSLIEDLLMMNMVENKSTEAKEDTIDINKFIKGLADNYKSMAEKKKIGFQLENELPEKFLLNSDRSYLTRILDNLISNAIKFSFPYHSVYLHIREENDDLVLLVKDEGQGITPDDRKNLFKKFKRLSAKPTGGESSTGLGLSIVKTLVEKLKGEIAVESEQRKGTTFTVRLPINKGFQQHMKIA